MPIVIGATCNSDVEVMTAIAKRQGKKPRLTHRRMEFALTYGVSAKTITDWISHGTRVGNPPPLNDPRKMAEWWPTCMSGPVPLAFRAPFTDSPTPGKAAPEESRDFSKVKGLTMEQNVEALRMTLAINKKLLDEALAAQPEQIVALRQRNYERCFNLLRLAEQSLTDLQKRRGELIERDKVVDDITKVVETLRLMRERMARDIITHIEQRCGRRMRRIMRQLKELLEPAIEDVRAAEEMIFARGFEE